MRLLEIPDSCSNLDCPNRPGTGRFVLMESERPVIGDYRYMRLWVCSPCAEGLQAMLKGD